MITPEPSKRSTTAKIRYQGRHPVFSEFQKIPSSYEPSSHRSQWTCKRCLIELSGRPQVLINHLLNTGRKNGCPYSNPDMRQQALDWQHALKNGMDVCPASNKHIRDSNLSSSPSTSDIIKTLDQSNNPIDLISHHLSHPSKRNRLDLTNQLPRDRSQFDNLLLSDSQLSDSLIFLLQACIWGGIPLSISENPFFIRFIRSIRPALSLPDSSLMITNLLNREFSRVLNLDISSLQHIRNATLVIDRWNDHRNLFNFLALNQDLPSGLLLQLSRIIDSQSNNCPSETDHQPVVELIGPIIEPLNGRWSQFVSICTENSRPMLDIRRRLLEQQPESGHLVSINCYAHSLSVLCKNVFAHPLFKRLYGFVLSLTNVFIKQSSQFSFELLQWAQSIGKRSFMLRDLNNRFLTIIKSFVLIQEYETGIRTVCTSSASLRLVRDGGIDPKLREAIKGPENFAELRFANRVIKPILDLIRKLQSKLPPSLADVQLAVILMCYKISRAELGDSMLKQHIMNCVNRFYYDQSSIYSKTALFLTPAYRDLALSKDSNEVFKTYVNTMIRACAQWGFSREDLVNMREELIRYRAGDGPYQTDAYNIVKNGYEYWKFHPHESPLKKGAIKLLSIIPSTTSVENVFRRVGSKLRPEPRKDRLNLLFKLARCKDFLRRAVENCGPKVSNTSSNNTNTLSSNDFGSSSNTNLSSSRDIPVNSCQSRSFEQPPWMSSNPNISVSSSLPTKKAVYNSNRSFNQQNCNSRMLETDLMNCIKTTRTNDVSGVVEEGLLLNEVEEETNEEETDLRILDEIDQSLDEMYLNRMSTIWKDDFDYFNFKLSMEMIEIKTIMLEEKIEYLGYKDYELEEAILERFDERMREGGTEGDGDFGGDEDGVGGEGEGGTADESGKVVGSSDKRKINLSVEYNDLLM
ncbi:expressed protein [Phakopsora pachyrhizi]|uniref:Expressed protein n=1 Tax=Phakopsora pachyrhizi TaxID=170000 RepID=A0AAV0BI90_PHAPC|nr:expressed protein [Phakopsora pachyrhizi]